jgi:alpha-tubulin suppressor-like RCC1 family protein
MAQSLHPTPTSHLLLAPYKIITFGSPLHPQLLARNPTCDKPAETPHHIPFFDGTIIRKIETGGWMCAGISQENDLYLWGGEAGTGEEEQIKCLPDRTAEESKMVKWAEIAGGDVLDVGIGDGHIIALTNDNEVWVCGRGSEGQLGLGRGVWFAEQWREVEQEWGGGVVVGVAAGGWGSWVVVKKAV